MPDVGQSPRRSPRSGKPDAWRSRAVGWVWNEANYAGGGMYEPDNDGVEKPMFPTHGSNPSDGEPDALQRPRPVR